jgi:small subunit ribosomal protein S18
MNDFVSNSGSGFEADPRKVFFRRRKGCPLSEPGAPQVDYKNLKLISRFVSERGRILPRRITSVSAKKQRELKNAIKRARNLALLPFIQLI